MERDLSNEIDVLKAELQEIKQLLTQKSVCDSTDEKKNEPSEQVDTVQKLSKNSTMTELVENLFETIELNDGVGAFTYLGAFRANGSMQSLIKTSVSADDMFKRVQDKSAAAVLKCIGNIDRLNLLYALLKKPMTVAEMVEKCGYNSTGQVYHLLNPLITVGIVAEAESSERGVYEAVPWRMSGVIQVLAGISDLVNSEYPPEKWEE